MATLIYLTVIGESHGGLPPARLASIAEAWPGADASEGKTREIFGCCLMSAYTPDGSADMPADPVRGNVPSAGRSSI